MSPHIDISNRTKSRIDLKFLETVVNKFLVSYKLKSAEVSVVFVGDALMRRLNRENRGKDKITDVLSFRDSDSPVKDKHFLGEIIIDYQQIKRQAKIFQTSVKKELVFILVHGLLHLIGYDDKTEAEAEVMDKLAKKFLAKHQL
jgi:probable rRNA maturation factor